MQSREGSFSPSPRGSVASFWPNPAARDTDRLAPLLSALLVIRTPHLSPVHSCLTCLRLTAWRSRSRLTRQCTVWRVTTVTVIWKINRMLLCLEIKCVPEARFRVLIWICFPCRYCSVRWLPWRHIWDYVHCFNSFESNCIVFTWL